MVKKLNSCLLGFFIVFVVVVVVVVAFSDCDQLRRNPVVSSLYSTGVIKNLR